jgi:hypothetical protein
MTFNEEQIEWIVMEVLRRIGVAALPAAGDDDSSANELRIDDQVVTLRSIEGRLNGISRLIVPKKAVITPAVRDELKARKIQLATSTHH